MYGTYNILPKQPKYGTLHLATSVDSRHPVRTYSTAQYEIARSYSYCTVALPTENGNGRERMRAGPGGARTRGRELVTMASGKA